jgi:hypothetical protein
MIGRARLPNDPVVVAKRLGIELLENSARPLDAPSQGIS